MGHNGSRLRRILPIDPACLRRPATLSYSFLPGLCFRLCFCHNSNIRHENPTPAPARIDCGRPAVGR